MPGGPIRGGSSVSARARTPSIRLHTLVDLLVKSLAPKTGAVGLEAFPLIALQDNHLIVNAGAVLRRFIDDKEFKATFSPGESSGFICDIDVPRFGTTAKVGGRLFPGSEVEMSKAVERLRTSIAAAICTALEGKNAHELCFDSVGLGLQHIGASVGETVPSSQSAASLVPVQFASEARHAEKRAQDVARLFTAVETVDGADCLDALLENMAPQLRRRGVDEGTLEVILVNLRRQREIKGSQLSRFFDFLDGEALARVRLQVSMRLMEAIAEHASPPLAAYVRNVVSCYERFGGPDGEALLLDATSAFGQAARTDLSEHLRKALFYGCLSVWPEWSAQLSETRTRSDKGFQTFREVSYRFRVNGRSPMTGQNAFDSRLELLHTSKLNVKRATSRVSASLAQLIFLHLVVPFETGELHDVFVEATRVANELKRDPVATVSTLLESLRNRSSVMQSLAAELVRMMKEKSRRIIEATARRIDHFTVSVHRDVINWDALVSMASTTTEVLITPERGEPTAAWFEQLVISDKPVVPGSIVSFTVRTELKERSLTPAGEARNVPMKRNLESALLPIRLVPYKWNKPGAQWTPYDHRGSFLDAGRGVEVQYAPHLMRLKPAEDTEKARTEQFRSAAVTAFALTVYVTLWELIKQIKGLIAGRPLAATLIRLQPDGRDVLDEDGSAAIYAISQALEKALSREVPVKLQGLVTGDETAVDMKWRKRGAVHALLGGQPLVFPAEGSVAKVALVSYVTRPCDTHPSYPDAGGHLYVARTYQAIQSEGNTTLTLDRMRSRYVENERSFDTPHLILEELSHLGNAGIEHVLLLSHHFGNPHLGRAADRHTPHGTLEFLDNVLTRYPNMHIYTLRRDVFPAMRLRSRATGESGFEVTQYDDHRTLYQDLKDINLRSLLPVYTFATLTTPDETGRPQSGFCTYFFDLESRFSDARVAARIHANILGTGPQGTEVLASLISTLRAVHFMESEKPAAKELCLPVLDPFDWMTPETAREAGELKVMSRRAKGSVSLSFTALLAHVTKILHRETE